MAENVRVIVRCRPMSRKEKATKCRNIVNIENCSVDVQNPCDPAAPSKSFTYDSAYDSDAPTETMYNDMCFSLVESVLEGYNATIFAYGQTGCGKSYTMQGSDDQRNISTTATYTENRGIISRSFDHIFEGISVANNVRYLVLISYLEIYNETIRDLLNPNENFNVIHTLKEVPGEGVTVPSLTTHTVHNAQECEFLLNEGNKNRKTGATLMNAGSSRSHSIFTINLEQIDEGSPNRNDCHKESSGIRKGKLNLVDLAGSERQNKTGAVGDRLKEATKINLSLSALGNVISALVDSKTKHIPYRDSKLTRLLQDSLGGNTKTLMIACISPADYNYDETLSTLRYASRAKNISNKPKINEDPKDALLREYQEEIFKLKKMLSESSPAQSPDNTWIEIEKCKLQREMEVETNKLKEQHVAQQNEKDELVRDMEKLRKHYEEKLRVLQNANEPNNNEKCLKNLNAIESTSENNLLAEGNIQEETRHRIEMIKNALIGGERANDVQLKEKRRRKKLAVERRLSALAHLLSKVEQTEDRDLLQGHYANIQQELIAKNESVKMYRHKVKALEREVCDLQSEFQLDRADYLETIRRLERNLKFYQQLTEQALPVLRKDGKYWDPENILEKSSWNDDLKKWILPEESMKSFKLPPATVHDRSGDIATNKRNEISVNEQSKQLTTKEDILQNYFRPRRTTAASNSYVKKYNGWKEFLPPNQELQQLSSIPVSGHYEKDSNTLNQQRKRLVSSRWKQLSSATSGIRGNTVLSSWLPRDHLTMSKTLYFLPNSEGLQGVMTSSSYQPTNTNRNSEINIEWNPTDANIEKVVQKTYENENVYPNSS